VKGHKGSSGNISLWMFTANHKMICSFCCNMAILYIW